jgi:hypothetical protein
MLQSAVKPVTMAPDPSPIYAALNALTLLLPCRFRLPLALLLSPQDLHPRVVVVDDLSLRRLAPELLVCWPTGLGRPLDQRPLGGSGKLSHAN